MTTRCTLTSGLTDYGTGSRTVYTLIAAEVLGLKPERIHMHRPDTDTAIASGPTVASRATVLGGNAARVAAERLNSLLTATAAQTSSAADPVQVLRDGELYIGPNEEPVELRGDRRLCAQDRACALGARPLETRRRSTGRSRAAPASPTSPITLARRWPK